MPSPPPAPADRGDRRRRLVATAALCLLALFFATWYALAYARAEDRATPPPTSSSAQTNCGPAPKDVSVNVYNATSRDGLAATVAEELRGRGFVVKTVANDPKQATVTGVGLLRHGTKGAPAADLLGTYVKGAVAVQDKRKWPNVDVVLGPDFTTLASPAPSAAC